MLIGATGEPARQRTALGGPHADLAWLGGDHAVAGIRPWGIAGLDAEQRSASDPDSGSWLALSGHLFRGPDSAGRPDRIAEQLLARLSRRGPDGIRDFDGTFAVAWFDAPSRRLHLFRDAFGVEPLFYAEVPGGAIFASRVAELRATGLLPGGLDPQGLCEYLTYCFLPSDATLDRGVRQVPNGARVVLEPDRGLVECQRFYRVPFGAEPFTDEREIADGFRDLLEDCVVRRLEPEGMGAFVSGGMDSSSAVTFARRHLSGTIRTFSYRCAGKSFDESVYARALAEAMETDHTEVEYGERDTLHIEAAVAGMDAPLCDIGLEIGSWLLGTAAEKQVDLIMTGDGGDELWASHPVYAAQRLFAHYDRLPVPAALHRGLIRLVANLPDSDQKRDWRVKLKRILPPGELPRELGPYRWRCYYPPAQLASLLEPEFAAAVRDCDPFAPILAANEGYDGPDDGLSPYIYNDYRTLTPYYFQRLGLLRRFGIEIRCPFYDRELVEFGARIPARWKLEGVERTKRLFRMGMEGVLPDAINHRQDKLGHSIPFKNWLREDGLLAGRIAEVCSPESVRARGIFRPDAVARMLEEHRSRRFNHSHRIWAIHVLELWLRAREGQP